MHNVDYLEQGEGETIILLHSTAAGNKQWRKLIDTLSPKFRVVAPNLYGYGNTTAWSDTKTQTLADQAAVMNSHDWDAEIPKQTSFETLKQYA